MKKRGFTLVELIAIIVIIAIIALITTPQVIKIIENGRKNTFLDSVNGIVRVVQLDSSKSDYESRTYTVENGIIKDESGNTLKSEGGSNENGTISIDSNGDMSYAIHNDKWCAVLEGSSKERVVSEYNGSC